MESGEAMLLSGVIGRATSQSTPLNTSISLTSEAIRFRPHPAILTSRLPWYMAARNLRFSAT
jgi:hypothetical protein